MPLAVLARFRFVSPLLALAVGRLPLRADTRVNHKTEVNLVLLKVIHRIYQYVFYRIYENKKSFGYSPGYTKSLW